MAGMIGKAALEIDWKHHATERSEEIKVFATLFPMVSATILIESRCLALLTLQTGRMPIGFHQTSLRATSSPNARVVLLK